MKARSASIVAAFSLVLLGAPSCARTGASVEPDGGRARARPAARDEHAGMRVSVSDDDSSISSCSSCSALVAHPEGPALSVSHAGSGAGISVWKAGEGAGVLVHGGRIEIADDGGVLVLASSTRVSAADRIEVIASVSIVRIDAAAGSQRNALALANGREGQLLWLHDGDDDPCVLEDDPRATIAPGSVRELLFVAGRWRLVG